MNLSELQRKLLVAARSAPANDHVPYTFEKRVMARLTGKSPADAWSIWGRALGRAALLCVVFALALAAGSAFIPTRNPVTLSQDVEQTLFAAVDNGGSNLVADQDL